MTGPEELLASVSRETGDRLRRFHELLLRWTQRINLVAPSTHGEIWSRHILDSVQLLEHAPPAAKTWIDLGSGGGLPGLVVAIAAAERSPHLTVTLVESDRRKATFLHHCVAELGLANTRVLCRRIEGMERMPQDVVSARALAPLPRLLELSARFRHERTIFLFLKGRSADSELTEARSGWHIDLEVVPSRTEGGGVILKVFEVGPRT